MGVTTFTNWGIPIVWSAESKCIMGLGLTTSTNWRIPIAWTWSAEPKCIMGVTIFINRTALLHILNLGINCHIHYVAPSFNHSDNPFIVRILLIGECLHVDLLQIKMYCRDMSDPPIWWQVAKRASAAIIILILAIIERPT